MKKNNCGSCVYFETEDPFGYTGYCRKLLQCVSSPDDAYLNRMEVPIEGFCCSEYQPMCAVSIFSPP